MPPPLYSSKTNRTWPRSFNRALEKKPTRCTGRKTTDTARPSAPEKGLTLTGEANEGWIDGQADLPREAVLNLVDNAIKYPGTGKVGLTMQRRLRPSPQRPCSYNQPAL